MFTVNTVLENCWEASFRNNNVLDKIYSFSDKYEFYGPNKIDLCFYNYNQIEFWYSFEESKFFIKNSGENLENVHFRIFDYYTDVCIYLNRDFSLIKDIIFWFVPPFCHNHHQHKQRAYI